MSEKIISFEGKKRQRVLKTLGYATALTTKYISKETELSEEEISPILVDFLINKLTIFFI